MKMSIETPNNLNNKEEQGINQLASLGFGQSETEMLEDTRRHIQSAEFVQRVHSAQEIIAL